jgi:hypothetical protein
MGGRIFVRRRLPKENPPQLLALTDVPRLACAYPLLGRSGPALSDGGLLMTHGVIRGPILL